MRFTKAVRVVANGIRFRSRLEVNTAYLLGTCARQTWEYERWGPFDIGDGVTYLPDFWIPNLNLVVEPRGYHNDRGDAQISAFSKWIKSGELSPTFKRRPPSVWLALANGGVRFGPVYPDDEALAYMVVGPAFGAVFVEYELGQSVPMMARCGRCWRFFFHGRAGRRVCRACGAPPAGIWEEWEVGFDSADDPAEAGLTLGGLPIRDWTKARLEEAYARGRRERS